MKLEFDAATASEAYTIAVSQTSLSNSFAVRKCSRRTSKIANDMPRTFRDDLSVITRDVWIFDYTVVGFVPSDSDRSTAKYLSMLGTQIVECQGRLIVHN